MPAPPGRSALPAGWPDGPTPVVDDVQVASVEHEGRPVALVRFTDQLGNVLDVQVSERASWTLMVGLTHFLRQTHSGHRCRACGLTIDAHPNAECPSWH